MNILAILNAIFPILDKVIPDADERMKIQAELTREAMNAESSFTQSVTQQIEAELQQSSWYIKGWRPTVSWLVILMNAWNFILRPIINTALGVDIEGIPTDVLLTFSGLWTTIYGLGRTFEKTGSGIRIGK